jgi:hypothetical protein
LRGDSKKEIAVKLNVFGRIIEVIRDDSCWKVFYLGNEGKMRPADDIHIPAQIKEEDVVNYLADICHEWATPNKNDVVVIH